MIDGDKAILYLKNKLINLIKQGVINATYEESKKSISFYISDIFAVNRPPLTLRLSNHHEDFNDRSRHHIPQGNDNLSIELYKPKGNRKNRVRTKINVYYSVKPKPQVVPFSITTVEYRPKFMNGNDVNLIYQSILNWIKSKNTNATYIDPLAKTSRRANIETHQANINLRRYVTQAEKNFYLRYGMGDSVEPRYNIIKENKNINCNRNMKLIRLTESDLHRIIRESVNKVLKEDVDMGQFPSAQERSEMHQKYYGDDIEKEVEKELRRRIGRLRNALSDADYTEEKRIQDGISELHRQLDIFDRLCAEPIGRRERRERLIQLLKQPFPIEGVDAYWQPNSTYERTNYKW